jgi:hypothetical protein
MVVQICHETIDPIALLVCEDSCAQVLGSGLDRTFTLVLCLQSAVQHDHNSINMKSGTNFVPRSYYDLGFSYVTRQEFMNQVTLMKS